MPTRRLLLASCLVASLASASPSLAADPSEEAYSGPGGVAQTDVSAGDPGQDSGNLPFTGLDLGLIAGGGVLLLGFGVGIRRLSGHPVEPGATSQDTSMGSATPRGPQ